MTLRLLPVFFALLLAFSVKSQCEWQMLACQSATDSICDASNNDPLFFNNAAFYDPVHQQNDLSEGTAELTFRYRDTCSSTMLYFELWLDLDQDDTLETLLRPDLFLSGGRMLINNVFGPGDTVSFDDRPLMPGQKLRFALEATASADTQQVRLRWTYDNAPASQLPQLPHGLHKALWILDDGAQRDTCEQSFRIFDCKAPAVFCINGLSASVLPTGMITLWAADFLQYADDNSTPSNMVRLGIVSKTESTGQFPMDSLGNPVPNVTFDCSDLGTNDVELWAIDAAGNASFCETFLLLQDDLNACAPPVQPISCARFYCNGEGVEDFFVKTSAPNPGIPPINWNPYPVVDGCFNYNLFVHGGGDTLTPVKDDNHLNGVTTFDILIAAKHILGIEYFQSPFQHIAADANKSNTITTFDLVEFRKLILGIYDELPHNNSWRFVPVSYQFFNPLNPLAEAFPEYITTAVASNADFNAVKIGDLNCSAVGNSFQDSDERTGPFDLALPDRFLEAGERAFLPVFATAPLSVEGLQAGFVSEPGLLRLKGLAPGQLPDMTPDCMAAIGDNELRVSWINPYACQIERTAPLFFLEVEAISHCRVSEALSLGMASIKPELYSTSDGIHSLRLQFRTFGTARVAVSEPMPNPTSAGVQFEVNSPETGAYEMLIYDSRGVQVWRSEGAALSGKSIITIPESALPAAGMYSWRLLLNQELFTGQIIKK